MRAGCDLGAQRLDRSAVREERRVAAPSRSGVVTSARSVAPTRIGGRPGGSQRAAPSDRAGRRLDVGRGHVEADPEEPRQELARAAARPGAASTHAGSSWNARASTALASSSRDRSSRTISTSRRPCRRRCGTVAYAALISMILNFSAPRGAETSTTSPFLGP